MRDRLNRDIKYREEFRPFAPVVPHRGGRPLFRAAAGRRCAWLASCRACFRSGRSGERGSPPSRTWTARRGVQALERDMAPRLHALLEAYGRRTGIPVLLNTSFNLAGEPIVTACARRLFDVSGAAGSTCSSRARPWSSETRRRVTRDRAKEDVAWSGSMAEPGVV